MSLTSLTAGDVMDRCAVLLNDPARTDYTYTVQIPYVNIAMDELRELLQEMNVGYANFSGTMIVPANTSLSPPNRLLSAYPPNYVAYPDDLTEVQEIAERAAGSNDEFVMMTRLEFAPQFPQATNLQAWAWEAQLIRFNVNGGASTDREIRLRYVRAVFVTALVDETSFIGTPSARSYLSYKTAALCARFIGENETRADELDGLAQAALERVSNITSKGKQEIMTRHRPFRASYKMRGY